MKVVVKTPDDLPEMGENRDQHSETPSEKPAQGLSKESKLKIATVAGLAVVMVGAIALNQSMNGRKSTTPDTAEAENEVVAPDIVMFGEFPILAVDMDGDGFEVIQLEQSTAHYDFNDDGFAEKTAWMSPDDGFLVLGGEDQDASAVSLLNYDSDGDGFITPVDVGFDEVFIWQDTNSDGAMSDGEQKNLSELSISKVPTTLYDMQQEFPGCVVEQTNSITWWNDETSSFGWIRFQIDVSDTKVVLPNGFEFSDDVFSMPQLKGAGIVADTAVEMSRNRVALNDGKELMSLLKTSDVKTFLRLFDRYLFTIAEVTSEEAFMEKWLGGPSALEAGIKASDFGPLRDSLALEFIVQASELHVANAEDNLFAKHPLSFTSEVLRLELNSEEEILAEFGRAGLRNVARRKITMDGLADLIWLMRHDTDLVPSDYVKAVVAKAAKDGLPGAAKELSALLTERFASEHENG